MVDAKFCSHCGNQLNATDPTCNQCGVSSKISALHKPAMATQKSATATLILCLIFGMFGAHRFYVSKIGTGLLMLVTGGGFGLWFLIDLILIVTNKFEDKQGNALVLTHNPSSLKKALMVIGAVVYTVTTYVSTFIAIIFYLTAGMVESVQHQLAALKAGNIESAYSYTSKDFQKTTPIEAFKRFLEQYPSLKNNQSTFFNFREIQNNVGTLQGTLTSTDGAQTPIEYILIKEDDKWRIMSIKLLPTGAGIKQE
jgi:TM2 domain-containing membrane protein YozV